jgi:hypothetical protein
MSTISFAIPAKLPIKALFLNAQGLSISTVGINLEPEIL